MIVDLLNKNRKRLFVAVGFFILANFAYNAILPIIYAKEAEEIKLSKDIMIHRKFDLVFGKDIKNKLLIYGDFSCPACSFSYNANIKEIRSLVDKKKIQFIYRPAPMSINSVILLQFLFCDKINKDQVLDALSVAYKDGGKILHDEDFRIKFKDLFSKNGIDTKYYQECINSDTKSEIIKNVNNAVKDGIKATPTIILNNKIVKMTDLYKVLKDLN